MGYRGSSTLPPIPREIHFENLRNTLRAGRYLVLPKNAVGDVDQMD